MRLYELKAEYEQALDAAIDVETGEVRDEALADLLDEIEAKLEEKALDVAAYIVNLIAEYDALRERAKTLDERARVVGNRVEGLRRYLASCITPGTKLKDDRVAIGWRKSEGVVLDVAVEELPYEYQRVSVKPALSDLHDALKRGDENAAKVAHLEQRQSVQVR